MLNLNVSVISLDCSFIGCAKEKFKGPIGVHQSTANPTDDLKPELSSIEES